MKLTTQTKILTAGLLAGLVMAGTAAVYQARSAQDANDHAYKAQTLATAYLAEANSALWALRWGVAQYLALNDAAKEGLHK